MIKKLLYGNAYYIYGIYDVALNFFDNQDCLSNDIIYAPGFPENSVEVFNWLSEDGMVKIEINGVRITSKGKAFKLRGGYVGKLLRERITYFAVIIGAICGIIAIFRLFM